MNISECLNCNNSLQHAEKFCPQCGQSKKVHRFTMGNFFHEALHAFTHTDKGIFHLLKSLAFEPGSTARNYITGKRKSYFNPFTFFLILMGVFVLSNNYFKKETVLREPDARVIQRMTSKEAKDRYIAIIQRSNNINRIFSKHGNVVAMIAVPFISLITWLFFRRKGFNFAEHLTANMMFVAFSNLVFTLVIFPLKPLVNPSASFVITLFALLLQAVYFAWGLNGFLRLRTAGGRTKSVLVSLLAIVLWSLFTLTLISLYIYQSSDFYQMFSRKG